MSETIGTILVDEGKITLKPFEGEDEIWEESKSPINSVGTQFIFFEGKKYYPEK
jgi:hypothetical protein